MAVNIPKQWMTSIVGIPVEGKSSECLICIKYRIIIVILIIISLGQIFYRMLQTDHACTHARTRANVKFARPN